MSGFKWFGDGGRAQKATEQVLRQAAEYVLEEANRTVPLDEGPLQASGVTDVEGTTATVSYDTPYAVVQHEDVTLYHRGNGRAKWLEMTMQEQAGRVGKFVEEAYRKALR